MTEAEVLVETHPGSGAAAAPGAEVDVASSDGELVAAEQPTGEVEVSPPTAGSDFKLTLPPPVEAASVAAIAAVQEWWATVEPLLRQLQARAMAQLEPLIKASAEGIQRLQLELQPHTQQATAVLEEWKKKMEPHTTAVLSSVKAAQEAVMLRAYEPALAAVQAATAAMQAHAATAAAFVQKRAVEGYAMSQEWLIAQQPVLQEAQKVAMANAAAALAALQAWQRQLEPLAREQFINAARCYKEQLEPQMLIASEAIKENAAKGVVLLQEKSAEAQKAMEPHVQKVNEAIQPHLEKANAVIQPHLEKANTALQPHVATLTEKVGVCMEGTKAQVAVWQKQLEPQMQVVNAWLLQAKDCLCAPFAKAIKYESAQADYPKADEKPEPVAVAAPPAAEMI